MSEPLTFKNSHVQHLRRLLGRRSARLDAGQFVVEGATLIAEAVDAGWRVVSEFVASDAAAITAGPVYELAPGVLERVASTESPQPNLAIVELPSPGRVDLAAARLVVVVDRIGDPGNLGTILRSSEAAGADAVVLTPGSADPYSPKVVRASAGAIFNVAVAMADLDEVAAAGLRLVGTSSHEGADYRRFDWSGRVAIAMGSEAHGLPLDAPIDEWVSIPHRGRAESLNVAMATTLLVFAASEALTTSEALTASDAPTASESGD